MKKILFLISAISLMGAGCSPEQMVTDLITRNEGTSENRGADESRIVVLPMDSYRDMRIERAFGEYFSVNAIPESHFSGYHVGDDIEVAPEHLDDAIKIRAIADGVVKVKQIVGGYGGFVRIEHTVDGRTIQAIYGHVDINTMTEKVGDSIAKGKEFIELGDNMSAETNGFRKHLHFGLYEGSAARVNGYAASAGELTSWLNPQDFFTEYGAAAENHGRLFDGSQDPDKTFGGQDYKMRFQIPAGMEVEYVTQDRSLNIYSLSGEGTALSRSQMRMYSGQSAFVKTNENFSDEVLSEVNKSIVFLE